MLLSRIYLFALCTMFTAGLPAAAQHTTIDSIRKLTRAEAEQARPVRIRGIVTYVAVSEPFLFVQDSTGGIRVEGPEIGASVNRGSLIEVAGVTAAGPCIIKPKFTLIGVEALPTPRSADIGELAAGKYDSDWVEIRGVVHSWQHIRGRYVLTVHSGPDQVRVHLSAPSISRASVQRLVDSRVRVRGASHAINDDGPVRADLRSLTVDQDVLIEKASGEDPFAIDLIPLNRLPDHADHRIRIRAKLSSPPEGNSLVLGDGERRVVVHSKPNFLIRPGDMIEAVGFIHRNDDQFHLRDSVFRAIAPSSNPGRSSDYLPLLTTVRDVRRLSPDEAKRGYPVRVTGVITYYDGQPDWNNIFIQDSTSGIYVHASGPLPIQAGHLVELTGFSGPGEFAPIILEAGVKVLSRSRLPRPNQPLFGQLMTGREDSQWVALEGIVRATREDLRHTYLEVANGNNVFEVRIPNPSTEQERSGLVDARVRVVGACGTIFNKRRQVVGIRLFTPSLSHVEILTAKSDDPFALKLSSIESVLQFNPDAQPGHRIKIAGNVIWSRGGKQVHIRDATGGLLVELDEPQLFPFGAPVEAIGFPNVDRSTHSLQRAQIRKTSGGWKESSATLVSAENVLDIANEANLVKLDANVINAAQRKDGWVLVLQMDRLIFEAFLDGASNEESFASLRAGSVVTLTGVCRLQFDEEAVPQSFRLLLRSPSDVAVLERPPWWTSPYFPVLLGFVCVLTIGTLVWVASLRRRVGHQTKLIQERLQRELALQARYQEVVENASDIIFTTDVDGNLTSLNLAGETTTGYQRGEILGKSLKSLLGSDSADPLAALFASAAAHGKSAMREYRLQTKDKRVLVVEVDACPIFHQQQLVGFQGIARDITARMQFQAELVRAKDAADAANKAKSEFLANMSHEIRTPMNGVLGMAELLSYTPLNAEQREYLKMVQLSADGLLTVINDILDFSKIEAGKLDLDPAPFDLGESLGDTLKTLGVRAHKKGLELSCLIRPDVPHRLVGDVQRLRQVVINLVGNAIKFTQTGEVVVEVEGAKCSEENEIGLHFSVRDTGIGIPANKQRVIFEAFTQADSSMTRSYGGTGLGLAISARLVKLMGGRIWVDSEPGKGSTFHFTVRFGECREPLPKSRIVQRRNLDGLAVLVVDDNATNRRILSEILMHWCMTPTAVANGAEAVDALRNAARQGMRFPLVLLDACMPELDGFAVADEIKRAPELAGATILMLSSSDRAEDAARCRELGIAHYLVKPIKQSELHDAIQTALNDSSKRRPQLEPAPPSALGVGAKSLHILLAEDNEVNRELAVQLLRKRGHFVTVACDGREALDALAREEFDAVLMDVQMPEIDGLEATAAIREREKKLGGHLPIIALTAHVMKGDLERCLAAGMDAYLSKPLRAAQLFDVLERLAAPAPVGESDGPAYDLAAALAAVEGNHDLLECMIDMFGRQSTQLLDQLSIAIGERDAAETARTAHKLRGSLAKFGAQQAMDSASLLERAANKSDWPAANVHYTSLATQVPVLLREMFDQTRTARSLEVVGHA